MSKRLYRTSLALAVVSVGLLAFTPPEAQFRGTTDSGSEGAAHASQLPDGFVGSEACSQCHADQFSEWSGSTHGTAGGVPSETTVIAPFDGTPIQFADGLVTPQVSPDGSYEFLVERPDRLPQTLAVDGVIGRGHMVGGGTQGFTSTFPDGTRRFLPFDYSADLETWFCNTAFVAGFWVPGADRAGLRADAGWLPVTEEMRMSACGDWPPARILGTNRRFANCQNCHGSQIEVEYVPEQARYQTELSTLQINCESCHGPGQVHVERAAAGQLELSPDLGLPALDTLGVDASLNTCFQCHALKRALDDQRAGQEVDYSLGLPFVGGDQPLLPDGRVRTFGYQQNHRTSACYLSGSMTCVDCHDPHSQAYRDPFGTALPGRFDDGQCTACHASKALEPESHTFHPPESDGARCVSCHMPYLQHPALTDAVPYGRSDHTIPIPRPGFDESVGAVSSCGTCHGDVAPAELAQQVADRWGELKPHRPEVAAGFAAIGAPSGAVLASLQNALTAGERAGLSKIMAIDQWMEDQITTGGAAAPPGASSDSAQPSAGESALSTLAGDTDEDVAATALAALHVIYGDLPRVRALLDGVRQDADAPDRLTRRWATALTQWGAQAVRIQGPEAQLPFLRRAQEVRPDAAETLVSLAAGLGEVGEWDQAVQTYLEALRHHPEDPVALVNLGLGLEVLGRAAEAEGVYERAVQVRPTEAVAHLNLGNMRFRRGDLAGAIESYRAAVRQDPGLSRAHFYLGVSLINSGQPAGALPSLYEALEFAPGDPEILEVIRQVEAAIGG
ncbi:MAG: tetratricopeptide repeat protein [Longimicrobiales bacterium]